MNSKAKPTELSRKEQIDHIARALPDKERAAYYREMKYCESLPENDEMLRILRGRAKITLHF